MATPITIAQNFKNGGIRQGNVFLVFDPLQDGTYEVTSLGRIKEPTMNLAANSSDPDSNGRTTVISFALTASVMMMQHTAAEIEAAGQLAYPPAASPEENGYDVLFTDGPMTKQQVEDSLNDVGGRIVPGILLENVFPKPSVNIDYGTNDSAIEITIDGILQPDALIGFEAEPVLTFAG